MATVGNENLLVSKVSLLARLWGKVAGADERSCQEIITAGSLSPTKSPPMYGRPQGRHKYLTTGQGVVGAAKVVSSQASSTDSWNSDRRRPLFVALKTAAFRRVAFPSLGLPQTSSSGSSVQASKRSCQPRCVSADKCRDFQAG